MNEGLNLSESQSGAQSEGGASAGQAPSGITITEKAAQEVARLQATDAEARESILRVQVVGGGCSGMSYKLGFDRVQNPQDKIFEQHGVRLVVDPKSFLFLQGTTLDYTDGLNGKGFVFQNPNASRTCGCGDSFSV